MSRIVLIMTVWWSRLSRRLKGYMPHWVWELRRRWRHLIPVVIWYAAIALSIAAVWIYVALKADG